MAVLIPAMKECTKYVRHAIVVGCILWTGGAAANGYKDAIRRPVVQVDTVVRVVNQWRSNEDASGQLEIWIGARQPIVPGQRNGRCVKQGGNPGNGKQELAVSAKTRGFLMWERTRGRTKAWLETEGGRELHESAGARRIDCDSGREIGANERWSVPGHTWHEVRWNEAQKAVELIGRVMVKEEIPWTSRYAVRHEYRIQWYVWRGQAFAQYHRNGFRRFDLWVRTPGYKWQHLLSRRGKTGQHRYTTLEGSGDSSGRGAVIGDGQEPGGGGWKASSTAAERELARTRRENQRPDSTLTKAVRIAGNIAGAYLWEVHLDPIIRPKPPKNEEPTDRLEWEPAASEPIEHKAAKAPRPVASTRKTPARSRRTLEALAVDAVEYEQFDNQKWEVWYRELRTHSGMTEANILAFARHVDAIRMPYWLGNLTDHSTWRPENLPPSGPVLRAATPSPARAIWSDTQIALLAQTASWVNDAVPWANTTKTMIEIRTGRDPWTGMQIDPLFASVSAGATAYPFGKVALRVTRLALKNGGRLLQGTAKSFMKAVQRVRNEEGMKGLRKRLYLIREVWDGTGMGRMSMSHKPPVSEPPKRGQPSELRTMPYLSPERNAE